VTTFYVSGKMRGLPEYGFPIFDSLSEHIRSQGDEAINPADHDREVEPDIIDQEHYRLGDPSLNIHGSPKFPELIGWDLRMIASPECDAIVMLPGWENSEGARHERYVAEACQKQVWLSNQDPHSGEWYLTLDSTQRRLAGAQYGARRVEGEDIEAMEARIISYGELVPTSKRVVAKIQPVGQVIGLVGYAQVGKDTLANQLVAHHGFTRIAFADVLRECLYALNPLIATPNPWGDGHMDRLQVLVDRFGWDYVKVNYVEVRELLQRLGTEVGRNILGTDIWVETALKKIQPGGKYVITDVRFPNEFAAIEKLGGTTVRILREGYGPVNDHWSEKALDSYAADLTVWNASTPEALVRLVTDELGLTYSDLTKDGGIPAPFSSTIGGEA
jgi:hypothetical protein